MANGETTLNRKGESHVAGSSWEWKPRGVGDWLDGIFQVYRGAFKPLCGLAASVMLPLGIVDGLAQRDLTRNAFAGVADVLQGQDPTELLTMAESTQGGSTALAFLGVLATTFLSIAGIWLVNEHLHGHRRRIGEAFNATPRLWARSLGVALLVFLGLLLLLAVVMGTSVGVSIVLHATWLNVVGAILWVGVATFFAVRWLFASQVLVAEGIGITSAIRRSFRLTRGSFWALVGRLIVFGLIIYALRAALDLGILMAAGAVALTRSTAVAVAFQGVASLIGALLAPLGWIGLTLLYYDLRIRKEGYDLEQTAQSLEQQASPV